MSEHERKPAPTIKDLERSRRQRRLDVSVDEEKARATSLLKKFHTALKNGGLEGLAPLPFEEMIDLFGLGSAYGNTFRDDTTVSDSGHTWDFEHTLNSFGVTKQRIICQQLEPFNSLMVIEREGMFLPEKGNLEVDASRNCLIRIEDPTKGIFQAYIELDDVTALVEAKAKRFQFGSGDRISARLSGTFDYEGNLIHAARNRVRIEKAGGPPAIS